VERSVSGHNVSHMSWELGRFLHRVAIGSLVLLPAGLVVGACDDESGQAPSTATSTNESTSTASTTPETSDSVAATGDDADSVPSETTDEDGANLLGGDSPEDRLMPDVICMNLQDAQDEIQDHGVFLSGSVDATGQGRNQIIDSNWVVVEQSPAAGAPIGEGDAELSVVKHGETNDC
jgi:hypothetical protein